MVIPVQYQRSWNIHPCNGLSYEVKHEYWHDPNGGTYQARITDKEIDADE